MNQKEIIIESEKFFRNNLPKTRTKEAYIPHVEGAVKYALLLAEKYNADKFLVEVSAWLHDIGADAGKGHSKESAEMAREFLLKFELSEEILKKILDCIKNHSMGQILII